MLERVNAFDEKGLMMFKKLFDTIDDETRLKFSKRELEVVDRLNRMIDDLEMSIRMKEA